MNIFIKRERNSNIKRSRELVLFINLAAKRASRCREINENSVFLEFHLKIANKKKLAHCISVLFQRKCIDTEKPMHMENNLMHFNLKGKKQFMILTKYCKT